MADPTRTRRKPATKNDPKQPRKKSRTSRKKQCNLPPVQSRESSNPEEAPRNSVASIMFAQRCELVPGFGLSIPFDGNRLMVLPFDEMPPSLQHFAFNDPACQQQALPQDCQSASDMSNFSHHGTHGAWVGNDQCSTQPASFAGGLDPTYSYQGQVWEMGDETRPPNLSMFPHGQHGM
ncbi:hypothetical protein ACHAPU_011422 [Fusarium lateritium]